MAGEDNNLSGKVGLDTTDFKTNVAALNRELRVVESGFRASAAALGDWANDANGLELRIKTLNSSIDIQKQKVSATRAEYERIRAEKGENSRAAQELEIKLNKETETLNKMESELGNTEEALQELREGEDEAGDAAEEAGEKAEESGSKWEALGPIFGAVGAAAAGLIAIMAAVAAAAIAAGLAIGGLVFDASAAAAELVDLSTKTGISTTQLQELDFIAGQVGTDLDTITGAQARLIRSMDTAREQQEKFNDALAEGKLEDEIAPVGELAAAFNTLGVRTVDAGGNLRDQQAVFNETIDALGRITNPAERDALAMQIFGKSAQELNPIIKAGSAEMARLAQEAHNVGAVMSEEDVAALEAFDDTLAALQAGLKGTLGTLAADFLPFFQQIFGENGVGKYLKEFSEIVRGANGDFGKIAEGLTGLITEIATDVAQQAPQFLKAGLSIVQSILDAIIAALPEMLTAAISIVTALIDFIAQALPQLLDAGVQILLTLITAIIENLPMLIDAALQAILTLAQGLTEALPTLIPAVVEAIITIVNTLVENLPMLIDAALQLILALVDGLILALPVLIAALPQIIDAIVNALLEAGPLIIEAGLQLIVALAAGIVSAIPMVIVAMVELIGRLKETLVEFIESAPARGEEFVQRLVDGIKSRAGALYAAVTEMIQNAIAKINELLFGLGSQSDLLPGLGTSGLQDLGRNLALSVSGGGRSPVAGNTQHDQFQFFAPVIIQDVQPNGLGDRLRGRRY
jgi:phage-related protein